jgi:hypothetical protein
MLLKPGSRGDEVAQMQSILLAHGFGFGQLVQNGVFDDPTLDALVYFQQTHTDANGAFLNRTVWWWLVETRRGGH